ncbi:MAG: hypothetical protein CSA66_03900 [Proteobacteria bacterium]|nr:MAG: hypothetical protein CSA66_03900 [Pseudomonadota bacterium]
MSRALAALVVASVVLGAPAAASALSNDAVRDAAREVLADPSYEKTLPTEPRLGPREQGGRRQVAVRRGGGSRSRPLMPSPGSALPRIILYLLIAVVCAAILFWIAREILRRRERGEDPAATSAAAGSTADDVQRRAALNEMPATLSHAHGLAAEGRYEAAIHLLLRGAIETVAKLARLSIVPAMTSREVLGGAELDADSEAAFRDLVFSVEISLFGGLAVSPEDFDRCAASFSALHGKLEG